MQAGRAQFHTEMQLLQGDERMRAHREHLKARLASAGGLAVDELEYNVRMMILSGRFHGSQGIPETFLMGFLPEKFLMAPSPFRTIAELSGCLPWLLRVHQSMQWVSQMPNGLMTVQRLICPAASDAGGLAAPEGVLAIDWRMIDEVMSRQDPPVQMQGPGMAGDPRFPRKAPLDPAVVAQGGTAPPPGTPAGAAAAEQIRPPPPATPAPAAAEQ